MNSLSNRGKVGFPLKPPFRGCRFNGPCPINSNKPRSAKWAQAGPSSACTSKLPANSQLSSGILKLLLAREDLREAASILKTSGHQAGQNRDCGIAFYLRDYHHASQNSKEVPAPSPRVTLLIQPAWYQNGTQQEQRPGRCANPE